MRIDNASNDDLNNLRARATEPVVTQAPVRFDTHLIPDGEFQITATPAPLGLELSFAPLPPKASQ